MATQIKLRRTPNVGNKELSQGEPLYDTSNNLLYLGNQDNVKAASLTAINKLDIEETPSDHIKFTIGGNQVFDKTIIPKNVAFAIDGISYDQPNNFTRVFRAELLNGEINCRAYDDNTDGQFSDFKPGAFIYLLVEGEVGGSFRVNDSNGSPCFKFSNDKTDKTYALSINGFTNVPFVIHYNKWYQFIYRYITATSSYCFDMVDLSGDTSLKWEEF